MELRVGTARSRSIGAAAAFVAALGFHDTLSAQVGFASNEAAEVTYTRDVALILRENCAVCHRPNGIGPMDLLTYEDARRYARRIREQVSNELMPPYAYDRDVGIQELEHDWRLSPDEIQTVVSWVDQRAPQGDPADLPPLPPVVDTDEWRFAPEFGPPDVIVRSTPIDIPPAGLDMWHRPIVPTGVTEDRCIRAIQVKPAPGPAKAVVHHANSTFSRMTDDGSFEATGDRASEYAMGKAGELIPEGVCRVLPAGSYVVWDIHLFPGGLGVNATDQVVEDNVVEMGLWLWPEDYQYEYKQDLALYGIREGELLMKPHGTAMTQGFQVFDHPVRIDSFQPHGHLRLRSASLEILYPETGRVEVISMISNWSAMWHQSHIYAPDAAPLVPAGAVLIMKQWYDNTENNPNVLDADMWVDGGSRTADEMSHAWIAVTHLDEEGYQELLEQRRVTQERRITDQE
jgi:mono/diheme cytochrome c family protein